MVPSVLLCKGIHRTILDDEGLSDRSKRFSGNKLSYVHYTNALAAGAEQVRTMLHFSESARRTGNLLQSKHQGRRIVAPGCTVTLHCATGARRIVRLGFIERPHLENGVAPPLLLTDVSMW